MEKKYWLYVINELRHLSEIKEKESWWCVRLIESNTFCSAYGMQTAKIKILKSFNPPIKSNELKKIYSVRAETFMKRNFQSKEFLIKDNDIIKPILSLRHQK